MPEHKRSRTIGRLFQDPMGGTAPGMTIEENLALAYLRSSKGVGPFSRITKKDKEEFREKLSSLKVKVDELGSNWKSGGGREKFMAAYEDLAVLLNTFNEQVANLGEGLGRAANILEEAENDVASSAGRIGF